MASNQSASNLWIDDAFLEARREFLRSVSHHHRQAFAQFGTIEHVYDAITKIQKEQAKSKTLVALKRIEPYLVGLNEYVGVIDTFAQVKPEILCLIWGPLKLILQLANASATIFPKLVALLEDIGHMLPHFQKYAASGLLDRNDGAKRAMSLFLRDILDLHAAMLHFFQKPGLHVLLEGLWPKFREKLALIQGNIESHKQLMASDVRLEHILQAVDFRRTMLKKIDQVEKAAIESQLKVLRDKFSSPACESSLQSHIDASSSTPGSWVFDKVIFKEWCAGVSPQERCLWIQGIPGAGKTTLTANVIRKLQRNRHVVLYAFLAHDRPAFESLLSIFGSLLFQLAEVRPDFLEEIYMACTSTHGAQSRLKPMLDVFHKLGKMVDPLFIVVDGLDEIARPKRAELLTELLTTLRVCDKIKVLISSREERDITRLLEDKANSVRVNEENGEEIRKYVRLEGQIWIDDLRGMGADDVDCDVIKKGLEDVVTKAKGMFLYAKLVLSIAKDQIDLDSIKAELENLPRGLDQAYGRILSRLQNSPDARKALLLIAYARRPLREAEILQALLVKPTMKDFSSSSQRKAYMDIQARCGPIIEIRNNIVHFVHFTAQEYLFSAQSEMFLKGNEGNLDLMEVCLTYFCFQSFDCVFSQEFVEKDKEDLRGRILSGDFIFFSYAADFWLEHSKKLSDNPAVRTEQAASVTPAVTRFYKFRSSSDKVDESILQHFLDDFRCFRDSPEVQQALAGSSIFLHRLRYGHRALEDTVASWALEDPTALSMATQRFQDALETLRENCLSKGHLKSPDCCKKLLELYGSEIFRCRWVICDRYRDGFAEKSERDRHEKTHGGLFCCPESNCPWATLGFRTQRDLAAHALQYHNQYPAVDPDIDISLQVGRLATSEVLAILRPAVMNGDVKLVGALLAAANERGEELDLDLLLQLAAWKGPDTIIEFMVFQVRDMHARNKSDETHLILQNALLVAVVVNNIDAVRCLIRNGAKADGNGIIHGEVRNQYLLPSRLMPPKNWKRRAPIIDYAFTKCNGDMVEILTENINPQYVVPPRVITNIIAKRESAQFAANLSKLGKFVSREGYSHGIHMAIQYTDEIALAICLKNGGDWNFIHKSGAYSVWGYPLMHAVNMFNTITIPSGSLNNIKRLLRAGADPYPKTSGQKNDVSAIMDLPQMKKLEEHIGMSWDALVQDIQGEP